MQDPKSLNVPAAASTTVLSSSLLPVGELNASIPLLQKIKQDDPRFTMLRELLTEMVAIKYDPQRKEEMMYKVIKIDDLLTALLPDMNPESAIESLEKYKGKIEVAKLNAPEQRALFVLYRNIFADFSHFLSDDEIKQHLEGFSLLCNGMASPAALANVKTETQRLTKTPRLKQVLAKEDVGLQRTNRLLCQAGFYLLRAQELASKGNIYGSCMELVSAGNCARYFHYSGANKGKSVRITEEFVRMRNDLVHEKHAASNAEKIMATIREQFDKIEIYMKTLQDEAKGLGIDVNVAAYITRNTSATSSPQTFDRRIFEQKDKEKELEQEKQAERKDTKVGEKDRDTRHERERDKERYGISSANVPPSSSSSHRSSYDDRQRGRDRERGYERDSRRSDDRRSESPSPRSSYGTSSSSSRHGERDRYDDRRPSSSSKNEPLDQSRQSQSSHAADEEERRRLHDRKRAKGTSEEACKEEPRIYSKKDDPDDQSRRHEKKHQSSQPSLGSSVPSSSTQRSSSHSERTSSSAYTGSSSHSDVRHESNNLSAHYASVLGRPKDWSNVERGRHDSQPEKPVVTEPSQPVRAKRERPQSEEETAREEQRTGLNRKF